VHGGSIEGEGKEVKEGEEVEDVKDKDRQRGRKGNLKRASLLDRKRSTGGYDEIFC